MSSVVANETYTFATRDVSHADPSVKLYSKAWSLNRQGSDNGKQVYLGQDKRESKTGVSHLTANVI